MKNVKIENEFVFPGGLTTKNRIGLPPMDTLMCKNGYANDFHIQHYGARAYGGVGMIIVESTAVSSEGRIREPDLGIWKDDHLPNLKRLVDISHQNGSIVGFQLNHAGSKAEVLEQRYGATNYYDYLKLSPLKLLDEKGLQRIKDDFVTGAKRAKEVGADFVELHGAHGYLLNQIMNKKLNEITQNDDINIRAKVVIDIAKEIYDTVKIPFGIRLSVVDHVEGGMTINDYMPLIKKLEPYLMYLSISSGETLSRVRTADIVEKEKLFRIPLLKELRQLTKLPLLIVGNIQNRDDVNKVLENGADIALIGRELLFNPNLCMTDLLDLKEVNPKDYGWNENPWFHPVNYKK